MVWSKVSPKVRVKLSDWAYSHLKDPLPSSLMSLTSLRDVRMEALNTLLGVKMETFSFLPHGHLHRATTSLASGFPQTKCSKKECMPKMKASLFNNLILGCHILYVRNDHWVRPMLKREALSFISEGWDVNSLWIYF